MQKHTFFAIITSFFIVIFFASNSFALSPEEHLPNEEQEQRAINLFSEVKCLICQGQSIESSSTEFSYEMRKLIRRKIAAGKTDAEVREELVQQFGEDILFSTQNNTPLFLIGVFAIFLGLLFFLHFFKKA